MAVPQNISIEGTLSKIILHKEDGWGIYEIKTARRHHRVSGVISQPQVGSYYEIAGTVTIQPKYGETLVAKQIIASVPRDHHAVETYLSTLKGIGPARAKDLVAAYGADAVNKLLNDPASLINSFGLSASIVNKAHAELVSRKSSIVTDQILIRLGFGDERRQKIKNAFPDNLAHILKTNPYVLASVPGVTIKHLDTHLIKEGLIDANDPRRLQSLCQAVLEDAGEQGHTWLPTDAIKQRLAAYDVSTDAFETTIQQAVEAKYVVEVPGGYAAYYIHKAEVTIKDLLLQRSALPKKALPTHVNFEGLNPGQTSALTGLLTEPTSVLTGGPGCGKTYLLSRVTSSLKDTPLILLSPTGKAARRLSESTGLPAQTIHSFLNTDRSGKGATVIIDESSMLGVELGAQLLKQLHHNGNPARVIFVGDADQLPSIDAGNVLQDIIQSKTIPTFELNEVMRQAAESSIISRANQLRQGDTSVADIFTKEANDHSPDFKASNIANDDDGQRTVSLVKVAFKRLSERPMQSGHYYDPIQDIQVLTPMNRGTLGTNNMNKELQAYLNPPAPDKSEITITYSKDSQVTFRDGDKVIFTKNDKKLNVVNGTLGIVKSTSKNTIEVESDRKTILVPQSSFTHMKLAYAMTVHKSQGSEAAAVISVFSPSLAPNMRQKALLYTAITRAKEFHFLLSTPHMVRTLAANNTRDPRYTTLQTQLSESFAHTVEAEPTRKPKRSKSKKTVER